MKKIFLIFFVAIIVIFVAPVRSFAQNTLLSEREMLVKLYEKMEEISKQQIEISKQLAVNNAKIEGMDKRIDSLEKSTDKRFDDANKRMDMLFYTMLAILAGIFGLIGFVVYDRQASVKPILEDNKQLAKEIEQLSQRELRHEENVANYFKKIAQIDSRFAGIL